MATTSTKQYLISDGYPNGAKSFDKPGRYIVRVRENMRTISGVFLYKNNQFEVNIDRYGNFSIEIPGVCSFLGMFNINDEYHWEIVGGKLLPPLKDLYPDLRSAKEMDSFLSQHQQMHNTDFCVRGNWYDRERMVYSYTCENCGEVAIATVPYPFCNKPHECCGYGTCQRNIACSE